MLCGTEAVVNLTDLSTVYDMGCKRGECDRRHVSEPQVRWDAQLSLLSPLLRFTAPLLTFQEIGFILLCHSVQEIGKNVGSFNSFNNSGVFHGHIILGSVQTRR